MIDLNMRALTALSLAFIPAARAPSRRHSQCRLDGRLPAGARHGGLLRVKAYVRSFSDALHHELKPRGIRVTNLAPGPVPTEFGERAGSKDDQHAVIAHAVRRAMSPSSAIAA